MNRLFNVLFIILGLACAGNPAQTSYSVRAISANDENIRITGRVKEEKDSVTIYWPGTSVLFRFQGDEVRALLRDELGENYFNVVIDGDSLRYIKVDTTKRYYTLASGLSQGTHTVELIKRTEWDKGKTWFYELQLRNAELRTLPKSNTRVMEFFGNSITAGYAIEDYSGGDSPDSIYTNNYNTYAALTARHFNADCYMTVKSGIGIMVSWFPLIMPEMYNRLDPTDSLSRWDFTSVTPDVVVINLMQNDSWLTKLPNHPSFKERFGTKAPRERQIVAAYRRFVATIRDKYPSAYIICALGSMDATKKGSPWPGYVERAVNDLSDPKIYTLIFPHTQKGGHPRKQDNEKMARILIDFIEKNVKW